MVPAKDGEQATELHFLTANKQQGKVRQRLRFSFMRPIKSQRKFCISKSECSDSSLWTASTYIPVGSFLHQPQCSCSEANSMVTVGNSLEILVKKGTDICVCVHACVCREWGVNRLVPRGWCVLCVTGV